MDSEEREKEIEKLWERREQLYSKIEIDVYTQSTINRLTDWICELMNERGK